MKMSPRWTVAFAAPLSVVALVMFLILFLVGISWWIALLIALVLVLIAALLMYVFTDSIVASMVGVKGAPAATNPRLLNMVEDICVRAGVSEPETFLISSPVPDAVAFGRSPGSTCLAVTSGLMEDLSLIELEGVLSREMSRAKGGDTRFETLAVPFTRMPLAVFGPLGKAVVDWARGNDRDVELDLAGVELSGYPPGLVGALNRIKNGSLKGTEARRSALTDHLWVRGQGAVQSEPGQWALDDRIALLREL